MSTKTTFKRIALVVVAALGFGVLTSVAPASAVNGATAASIVVGDIPAVRVGATAYVPVKLYLSSSAVAADTMTIVAKLTSAPIMGGVANATSGLNAGGTAGSNDADEQFGIVASAAGTEYSTGTNTDGRTTTTAATTAGNTIIAASGAGPVASVVDNYVLTAADIAAGYHTTYVKIVPDVAGSYTVLVSTNASSNIYYSAGDKSATFTISTGSAPTGVTLTTLGGGTITGGSPTGNAILVSLVGGSLAGDEEITLTPSGTGKLSKGASAVARTPDSFAAAATAISLTSADFVSGSKIVWLTSAGTAAETVSLTATGGAGVASTVTATKTYSVVAGAGSATVVLTLEAPSSTATYAMTNAIQDTDTITVTEGSTSQKVGFTTPASMTAQKGYITVVDTAGTITGVANLSYDVATSFAATTAASGGAFSFAASGVGKAAGTTLFTVTIPAGTSTVMGILTTAKTKTFVTAARTNSAFTVTPASTILAAPAAAIALTATLEDQFGAARANVVVTITTSGRNNPAAVTKTTDADGMVAFTTADASTSTTALTDTVTFSASGATSESVTINYANTAVGTVTVTGGNTTASVNALTNTDKAISVGTYATGAEAGAQDVTATVKDANGNALAGVAVTFSVAGTTAAILSTTATVYTGADGTAVGSLYAWATGTYTYTVTAGGKSTTGTMTFASITPGNTRVVSATVSGNVVTGKAVDRFGNAVKGATLYASTTGGANIGGAFATSGSTLADGTISWVVSGSGSVTVSAVNPADPAGTTAYQTCALAGNATCATASTAAKAYTAATAGTATAAEENVGSSFAPAGVASVTVGVENIDTGSTATDAAAEATDAANAATDAANAAAEAADAATAAAQDAADAVAALSAQVASLISGLKSQLTALTNLVIKIQKKVKA
jgi:hypothetical protein